MSDAVMHKVRFVSEGSGEMHTVCGMQGNGVDSWHKVNCTNCFIIGIEFGLLVDSMKPTEGIGLATVEPKPPTPYVGMSVHYVSYGTPGGEYQSVCRAAVVSELFHPPTSAVQVGLVVLNPTGNFFHSLSDGGCPFDRDRAGGTWHDLHS